MMNDEWFNLIGNITGIIAFVISLVNFIYFFVIRKRKLYARFSRIAVCDNFRNTKLLKVEFSFVNKSQLPISITRISLKVENKYYDPSSLPRVIEEYTSRHGKEINAHYVTKSEYTPVNLPALGAHSGYFAFELPQGILSGDEKSLTFRVCTNRGRAVQKTFALNEDRRV